MSNSFNKITVVGHLGRDPELRYTPEGTPVCSFSMATNEKRKDRDTGEKTDIRTWFRITLWGRLAETASQYLQKGKPVYIEGRLRTEEYTDRDGNKRTSLEVTGTDMQFIGSNGNGNAAAASASQPQAASAAQSLPDQSAAAALDDDEPPF